MQKDRRRGHGAATLGRKGTDTSTRLSSRRCNLKALWAALEPRPREQFFRVSSGYQPVKQGRYIGLIANDLRARARF